VLGGFLLASLPRETLDNQLCLGCLDALAVHATQKNFEGVAGAHSVCFDTSERGTDQECWHDPAK
jgi:hypothetical protein